MERLIRLAKGVLMGVGFIAFALSILAEPNVDVQYMLMLHGINPHIFVGLFALAGLASFVYAGFQWRWNGLIFAPYGVFTAMAVEAAFRLDHISGATATAYLVLLGFFIIEYVVDNDGLKELVKELFNRGSRASH